MCYIAPCWLEVLIKGRKTRRQRKTRLRFAILPTSAKELHKTTQPKAVTSTAKVLLQASLQVTLSRRPRLQAALTEGLGCK
jgi:hypothetical protein